jgi:hypothetical protein
MPPDAEADPACVSGKRSVDNCCLDMQQGLRACSVRLICCFLQKRQLMS